MHSAFRDREEGVHKAVAEKGLECARVNEMSEGFKEAVQSFLSEIPNLQKHIFCNVSKCTQPSVLKNAHDPLPSGLIVRKQEARKMDSSVLGDQVQMPFLSSENEKAAIWAVGIGGLTACLVALLSLHV